jgi:REP element-mobilizing transposase RayT
MSLPPDPRHPGHPHRLYVHLAWSTLARVPSIPPARRAAIESHILAICRQAGAQPVEARAFADRVHLVVRLPPALSVQELADRVRREVVARLARSGLVVRWSQGFAAVSVAPSEVRRTRKRLAGLTGTSGLTRA